MFKWVGIEANMMPKLTEAALRPSFVDTNYVKVLVFCFDFLPSHRPTEPFTLDHATLRGIGVKLGPP